MNKFIKCVTLYREDLKTLALKAFANLIFGDYRLTWPFIDWWQDSLFNEYLNKFGERDGFDTHRRWMLYQLLRLTAYVPGDTAECGVFRGSSSWLILAANSQNGPFQKMHYGFDSFEGLSTPSNKDGKYWREGDLVIGEGETRKNLESFKNFELFKGWIPDRFPEVQHKEFSFVHIDVDLYEPTRESLEFFYPRLNPGGIILCDDYGSSVCPGATKACDEFLEDKPEKMLALDASSGFFIKGVQTVEIDLSHAIERKIK